MCRVATPNFGTGTVCRFVFNRSMSRRGIIEVLIGGVLLIVAGYGLLWIVSSSHLAHEFCEGDFSLFHEQVRCRQPYFGLILFAVSAPLSCALFILGRRNLKNLTNDR